jgi:hypothetical protein
MEAPPYDLTHPHLGNRTEFERVEHREDKAPHLEMFSEYEDHLTGESGEHAGIAARRGAPRFSRPAPPAPGGMAEIDN